MPVIQNNSPYFLTDLNPSDVDEIKRIQFGKDQLGIFVFMFAYPNFFGQDTNVSTYNRGDPNWWFRQFVDALIEYPSLTKYIVINPDSGPGDVQDGQWQLAIDWLHGAGCNVLGYIGTNWTEYNPDGLSGDAGNKTLSELKDEINTWVDFYPDIDGFEFDEVPFATTSTSAQNALDVYKSLQDHARSKGYNYIFLNPGQQQEDDTYFEEGVGDLSAWWEKESIPTNSDLQGNYSLNNQIHEVPPQRLVCVPHNIGTISSNGEQNLIDDVSRASKYYRFHWWWYNDAYGNNISWDSSKFADWTHVVGKGLTK